MPATRASKHPHSHQPLKPHYDPPSEADIIVLSSDDESSAPPKKPAPTKRITRASSKAKTKADTPLPLDIVEISDSDEPVASSSQRRKIESLQKQLKEARLENERLRKAKENSMDNFLKQVELLKADAASHKHIAAKSKDLLTNLDDYVSCEICTLKMWTPYALACGHAFCYTCLHGWFNSVLAPHKAAHPEQYTFIEEIRRVINDPHSSPAARRDLQERINAIHRANARPELTCPTCRATVTTRPCEVFSLKHIVRLAADAAGETSPKKAAPTRGAAHAASGGVWDAFFISS